MLFHRLIFALACLHSFGVGFMLIRNPRKNSLRSLVPRIASVIGDGYRDKDENGTQQSVDGSSEDGQQTLRRLLLTLSALQAVGLAVPPLQANADDAMVLSAISSDSLDAIFPPALKTFAEQLESNPLFVFTAPTEPFTFTNPFTTPIALSEGIFGVGIGESTPVEAKKWFITGFDNLAAPKLPTVTQNGDVSLVDSLRNAFRFGISQMLENWMSSALLIAFILVINSIQYADQLKVLKEDEEKRNDELLSALGEMTQEAKDANALRADAVTLASQIEELKASLQAAQVREKISSSAVETKEAEAVTSVASLKALKSELDALRTELADIKASSSTKVAAAMERVDFLQTREKRLVDAVKIFMVEQGYMSPAIAGMLLSEAAFDIIDDAGRRGRRTASTREKELERENASLKLRVQDLSASVDSAATAESASKAKIDSEKYVKALTAEIDDLKQKLLSSDERFFDLNRDLQSKVDSAKAVAKQLNARLVEKDEPDSPPQGAGATSSIRLRKLKELTPAQRKRLTKAELEADLKQLGVTEAADGRLTSALLKQELLSLLDDAITGH